MMGLSDGGKSFRIGLAVLIQYRSVTDTQPPSHVAVDITLNAQASSLIKAVLNKKVLRRLLKVSIEHVVVFSSDGSRFQARGAATENALSPSLRVVRRTK